MGQKAVVALHDVLVVVDAEHLGAVRHQFEGEGASEASEADHGHGARLGDPVRVRAGEERELIQ